MAEEEKTSIDTKTVAWGSNPNSELATAEYPFPIDDENQETREASASATLAPDQPTTGGTLPTKSPKPLSPKQQAENTLREAFPTVETAVVRAVLVASNYNVERAFHALLGMTDPNAQEDLPPPKPPRPSYPPTSTAQKQLEEDEMYARQLAEHYSGTPQPRQTSGATGRVKERPNIQETEREYSFFDDDLPVIRENIRKGFLETQSKVNAWVQNFKKKLDGDDEPRPAEGYVHGYGESQTYNRPRRSGDLNRRSSDRERYDADPRVLSDDFTTLELRDGEAPSRPPRPLADPKLAKASPPPDRRKVSFQDGPPEHLYDLSDMPDATKGGPVTGGKFSKWQPLSNIEPSPVVENDPFSLGDSEDERDARNKDLDSNEAGRVKKTVGEIEVSDITSGLKNGGKSTETR